MIIKAIKLELERRNWTVYQLAQAVEKDVPKAAVYEFLKGERNLSVNYLEPILKALELELTTTSRRRRK